MSMISYSHDIDSQPQYRNPNSAINPQQVEEEDPPFPQNFPSPLFYENQLLVGTMAADHTQQTNYLVPIWNEPMRRVNAMNMNTAHEMSTINTSSAGTDHLHPDPSHDHSSKMKKGTLRKGSTARKSGKKDRHSKINTAQGVRDRRMRLSLHIAHQFFDLQDMLGYDKASKTIDWLFSKSKNAIKQLQSRPSQIPQTNNNNICRKGSRGGEKSEQKRKVIIEASEGESGLKTAEKSVTSGNTKSISKELRDKARARARERTREKMIIRCLEKSNLNFCDEAYNLAPFGTAEYLALLNATASSSGSISCSMVNYDDKNGEFFTGELDSFSKNPCYTGNWEITPEYSNPNSNNFHENPGYHYQYSDDNQVDQ